MIKDNQDGTFTVIENGKNKGTFNSAIEAIESSSTNSGRTNDLTIHELNNSNSNKHEGQGILDQIFQIFKG